MVKIKVYDVKKTITLIIGNQRFFSADREYCSGKNLEFHTEKTNERNSFKH